MDHVWASQKLGEFADAAARVNADFITDERREDSERDALQLEPVAQAIMNAYEPGLGDYPVNNTSPFWRWNEPKERALRARGLASNWDDLKERLRPDAPSVSADAMHAWAWEGAAPLWSAGAHREAVGAAARTVNARIQQKSERHDITEAELVMSVLDTKKPESGKPRLWVPGDRTSPSWHSLQDGARFFAAGCFRAIRNPAAHDEQVSWGEIEAFEYLCAFSALARWIDRSELQQAAE